MAINLTNNAYQQIAHHVGHKIVCVQYADGWNVAIECETCGTVLLDADKDQPDVG